MISNNSARALLLTRSRGLHLYVSIDNFDDIIADEESRYGEVKRSLKLLDSLFQAIRKHIGKGSYPGLFIEKVTGNRMHIYIEDGMGMSPDTCMYELLQISVYAYQAVNTLNQISKLGSIKEAVLRIGADYGSFYKMTIDDLKKKIAENTSVGFAANYACKLQTVVRNNALAVSEDDFNIVPESYRCFFAKAQNTKLEKYHSDKSGTYYKASLASLSSTDLGDRFKKEEVEDIANRINLSEMTYRIAQESFNLQSITEKEVVRFQGCVMMADIRNFTGQFKDDDSNLDGMAYKAETSLIAMINEAVALKGTHIQVQGDKEVAVFIQSPNDQDGAVLAGAILSAMKMLDKVSSSGLNLGIGISYGRPFAARLDTRGLKEPVILGSAVSEADYLEDDCAKEGEIAISRSLYNKLGLFANFKYLQAYFKARGNYYVTTSGYEMVRDSEEQNRLKKDEARRNYHGAYRK